MESTTVLKYERNGGILCGQHELHETHNVKAAMFYTYMCRLIIKNKTKIKAPVGLY